MDGDSEVPEIALVCPLPGFPSLTRFVLVRIGESDDDVLYELRSVEEPEVRFLVAAPSAFFPDYAFELDDPTCADLDLATQDDALVLVILTIGEGTADTTANLLAPVVVNARTRRASQVILSGTDWPVRAAVG